jgi:hypothetical protein
MMMAVYDRIYSEKEDGLDNKLRLGRKSTVHVRRKH